MTLNHSINKTDKTFVMTVSSKLFRLALLPTLSFLVAGCSSSGSDIIDGLLGNLVKPPILTSIADQVVQQTDTLTIDVDNISDIITGSDEGMTYSCFYDSTVDGTVDGTQSCDTFTGVTATFNPATGELSMVPDTTVLGNYEVMLRGSNDKGTYSEIFQVGVRLKFNGVTGISAITGTSATLTWTQPTGAVGYRVYRLNQGSGLYELFLNITGGAISGYTLTGLVPNTPYVVRVQSVDSFGNEDGNVVSRSFTTTELVQFSMLPLAATVPAGTAQAITITAYNADGSPQTIGGLAITPQIAAGSSSGNFSAVTDNNDGTYTFNFTPTTVGTALTIDITTIMTFYMQNTTALTIVPGPPSNVTSTLVLSANTVISNQNISVQANIRDAYSNPIASGSTITFLKTGGTSTGTYAAVNNAGGGLYTTTYTGVVAGTAQTLRVQVDATILTLSGLITVIPGAPVSAQSLLAIGANTIASGTATTITATLRDVNNNPVPSGISVQFNKAGGTATGTFTSVVNAGAGVYTTTYTGVASGTAQTITIEVDGVSLTPSVTVAVVPGAPVMANSLLTTTSSSIVSGQFATVTATLRDINNNPVPSGITVTFGKTGGTSTGTFGTINNQGAGEYTVNYTGVVAGTAQTITVLVGGVNLGLSTNIAVTPGAPNITNSSITSSASTVVSGNLVTLTMTLRDVNNNLIPSGVLVGIAASGGTSTGTLSAVTNAGAGVYTATYTGVVAGTAQNIGILVDASPLGPNTPVQVLVGAPHLANSGLAISASTVVSGQFVTVTGTFRDVNNNPITGGITITFGKSGGTATGTFGTVNNLVDGTYTVRYTGVGAGTAQTIKVYHDGVDLGPSVTIAVTPGAPSATMSGISVSGATVQSGSTATVTATIKDDNNNPISSGITVGFTKAGGTSTGNYGTISNVGGGIYTVPYEGVVAGTAQTLGILVDSNPLGPTTTLAVVYGAPNAPLSTLGVTSNTVTAGQSITLTFTLRDANGNPISAGYAIGFAATGGTSTGSISATSNDGGGIYTATFTGDVAGTAKTLQATVDLAAFGPTQPVTVQVGAPVAATSTLTVTPSTIASGSQRTISALIRDVRSNPITTEYAITFDAIGGTSTGSISSVNNGGSGNFSVTYEGVVAGTAQTVRVLADGIPISGLTSTIQTVAGPVDTSNSSFNISQSTVQSGTAATMSVVLRDVNNNRITGATVTFNKSSTAGSDGTISAVTETTPPANSGNYEATYTAVQQGASQVITLVVNGSAFPGMTVTTTVTAGPPSNLALTVPTLPYNTTVCTGPFTVTLKDNNNNTTFSLAGLTIAFASPDNSEVPPEPEHTDQMFADSACATPLTELEFNSGVSAMSFYYRNYLPISYTLTLDAPVGITDGAITMTTQPVLSYIGSSQLVSTMSATNTSYVAQDQGTGFGFVDALDMVVQGDYLYVSDRGAFRILRFNMTTTPYTYDGWAGYIESTEGMPTSGACSGNTVGAWTNGWCKGGRPQSANGMSSLYGLGADSNYVYAVVDNRIIRVNIATAQYGGWIGRVTGTNVTGNACTLGAQAINSRTNGWCTGGSYQALTTEGGFNAPSDVTAMGGKLYITDTSNHRVQRWSETGAYEGWVASVNTSPTSSPDAAYAASCAAATTGNFTPGFCSGGVHQAMTRRDWSTNPSELPIPGEGFSSPTFIDNDGTSIYITDQNNGRIVKINVTENPLAPKWIGRVIRNSATNPVVPATAAGGGYTLGWTTGGGTQHINGGTGFNPIGIAIDTAGDKIFFTDAYQRALRANLSDGQDLRSIGRVSASPSGGYSGCSSTPVMGTTPGWCTGGTYNRYGGTSSTFSEARATAVWGTELLVLDRYTFRIQRFNKSTGVFIGWMGAYANNQDTWTMTSPGVAFGRRGWNNQSFWDVSSTWFSSMAMAGDYLYIPDFGVGRIKRYNKRYGRAEGYIGVFDQTVSFIPTGPDECLGVTSGMTPFWCTGGGKTQASNGVQGYNTPSSVASDGTYLYVANASALRVDRVEMSNATYRGWIGRVNAVPTDGDTGCTTAATGGSGIATPGWCIGGSAQGGDGPGQPTTNVRSVYYDTGGSKLYYLDTSRLFRVNPTTGVVDGTLGQVTTAAGGCTVGTAGVPSGWCTSNAWRSGAGADVYGALNEPANMWADATYIFIADMGNHRIHRFNKSTGAPAGFIGRQAAVTGLNVSGGIGACAGLVAGNFPRALTGWCYGTSNGVTLGTAQAGATDGDMNSPRGITGDANYIYVADYNNNRIVRYHNNPSDLSLDGKFAGWKGAIGSTTGMTPADCVADSAAVGYTRRWCYGGAAINSGRFGGFNQPAGLASDSNYLYVHDNKNNRIVTIPKD